ncbi:unnamed protein product [Haemonchus placei]|uniref:Ovule protein n=1 Tax=Haemonchus placei TaxID=6290 RepID=A0A0N4VSQ1_HAEPC|nr:unnamed protein product [Haemonchus placei]
MKVTCNGVKLFIGVVCPKLLPAFSYMLGPRGLIFQPTQSSEAAVQANVYPSNANAHAVSKLC